MAEIQRSDFGHALQRLFKITGAPPLFDLIETVQPTLDLLRILQAVGPGGLISGINPGSATWVRNASSFTFSGTPAAGDRWRSALRNPADSGVLLFTNQWWFNGSSSQSADLTLTADPGAQGGNVGTSQWSDGRFGLTPVAPQGILEAWTQTSAALTTGDRQWMSINNGTRFSLIYTIDENQALQWRATSADTSAEMTVYWLELPKSNFPVP